MPRPYRRLQSHGSDLLVTANGMVEKGWIWSGYEAVPLAPPMPWGKLEETHRSWETYLQAWRPLETLLSAYEESGEARFLDLAVSIALDWTAAHMDTETASQFAWYDMVVGMRAYILAALLDRLEPGSDAWKLLAAAARRHVALLDDDAEFKAHSNHGVYQAVGLLALGVLAPDAVGPNVAARGRARMLAMLDAQFTPEGGHREHSPGYAASVLHIVSAVADLLTDDPLLLERQAAVEEALPWLILPDGTLAMFGDTDHRTWSAARAWPKPSGGARGFPQTGYWVVRSPDSYLAQISGFHSRVHKHADDLAIIWYDHGHHLLIDAGRYGYPRLMPRTSPLFEEGFWYEDPHRIYVESTHAHNTVEVDGRSHPRRKLTPYGSGLKRFGESGGVFWAESEARPRRTIRHVRVLAVQPGRWLLVFDWLHDTADEAHRYTQWFHTAPDLQPVTDGAGIAITVPGAPAPLRAVSLVPGTRLLPPVRGVQEPRLQGWWAPGEGVLEPADAFAFDRDGDRSAVFATVFAFSEALEPDLKGTRVGPSGRTATLAWRDHDGRMSVSLERPPTGELTLRVDRVGSRPRRWPRWFRSARGPRASGGRQ